MGSDSKALQSKVSKQKVLPVTVKKKLKNHPQKMQPSISHVFLLHPVNTIYFLTNITPDFQLRPHYPIICHLEKFKTVWMLSLAHASGQIPAKQHANINPSSVGLLQGKPRRAEGGNCQLALLVVSDSSSVTIVQLNVNTDLGLQINF